MSLVALLINQLVYKDPGLAPGWVLGILSLAVQAIVFFFVSRGHPITRALTVAF